MTPTPRWIGLAGPTASGKTAAALALAEALPLEIVSVDSALVYRGMDIGTAKPSAAERAVTLCNAGLMALAGRHALALLTRIGNDNAAGEYYLPDAVALAAADGLAVAVVPVDEALPLRSTTREGSA